MAFEGVSATPATYPGIPGEWWGVPYDPFEVPCTPLNVPNCTGLPPEVMGCLAGT